MTSRPPAPAPALEPLASPAQPAPALDRRRFLGRSTGLAGATLLGTPTLQACGGSNDDAPAAESPVAVIFMPSAALSGAADYPGFKPSTTTLRAGSIAVPNPAAPTTSLWGYRVPVDITFDRDVEVTLRDGTRMVVDIYRPAGVTTRLPAIMGWSPYGKSRPQLPPAALRSYGIDTNLLSGLQRFEGPDPAWWCAQGYAVVSPDPRGSYVSEGDIIQWGPQCAQDGHDVIEWIAKRDWSNGKVGLTGNSWLAISQWHIASAQPPSLAAIAPWEGLVDTYRGDVGKGGIPDGQFANITLSSQVGRNRTEDTKSMIEKYPLMNSYWRSKIAALDKVKVPAYVVASWTNSLHSPGTFAGWEGIASTAKWLRVHNSFEWPDYYEYRADLLKFFDHYLKGATTDWLATPAVRLSVFDEGFTDVVNRPEAQFPLARTVYKPLYLNAAGTGSLQESPVAAAAALTYVADDNTGQALFTYTFAADTELTGYMTLRVWLEADGHDDMDVFFQVRKLGTDGRPTPFNNAVAATSLPTSYGPFARLRVSQRELDAALTKPYRPEQSFTNPRKLVAGTPVRVEVSLAPAGTRYRAGQSLQLSIAGFRQWPKVFRDSDAQPPRLNRGRHIVRAGGAYDSHLVIPVA